jgi:hypothetical protein
MTNFDFLLSTPDFDTFAEYLGNVSLGENEVDTMKAHCRQARRNPAAV